MYPQKYKILKNAFYFIFELTSPHLHPFASWGKEERREKRREKKDL
jgi:hypothetical protein